MDIPPFTETELKATARKIKAGGAGFDMIWHQKSSR